LSSPSELYTIDSGSMGDAAFNPPSSTLAGTSADYPLAGSQETPGFRITRVCTLVMNSVRDVDPNIFDLIRESMTTRSTSGFERRNTMMWLGDHASEKDKESKKAASNCYMFFLFLIIVCWTVGSIILHLRDFDVHYIVYETIFFGLLFIFVFLDWLDRLRKFISNFENCWNVPKRSIHIEVEWRHGETEECRRLRKNAREHIGDYIKDYLSWNGWCLFLLGRIRTKIEDDSVVVTGMLSKEKLKMYDKNKDQLNTEILEDNKLREKLKSYHCKIIRSYGTEHVEHRAPQVFVALFFIFAFVAYILLKVTDEEDGYEVPIWMTNLAEIFFYTAIFFMIMAIMSNWTMISFACSEKAYLQGLLIVSVIGFLLLILARTLRPPASVKIDEKTGKEKNKFQEVSEITWHKYHNWNKQIGGIVLTVVVLWVFFVFFFVISVSAFGEFADEAAKWGVGPALSTFVTFSMVIMLAPPAPGNVIDVFGGFLIVTVLIRNDSETWSFLTATALAIVSIALLHYTGACIQWMIGRKAFAQQWMNRSFPIEMLATSDAVLGDANWFKVGLVGFVFLDTANGLNQGRIEMDFWTQLLSEWGAWPNGLSLVTFGATLAVSGLSCRDDETSGCLDADTSWTSQAIPMLFLMSGITQIVGTSLGAGALAGSVDTDRYVMSREKWHFVHTLMKIGYIPTKKGWTEDVYELAESENDDREPYFVKACRLQNEWLKKRMLCENPGKVTELHEKFKWEKWIPLRYQDHLSYLLVKITNMEKNEKERFKELFRTKKKEDIIKRPGMWDDVHKNKSKKVIQITLVSILVSSFYICMLGFYLSLDLEIAVSEGLDFLIQIKWYYWISAAVFILCSCVYYWDYLLKSLMGTFTGLLYFIKCCPTDKQLETGFLTPVMKTTPAKGSNMVSGEEDYRP